MTSDAMRVPLPSGTRLRQIVDAPLIMWSLAAVAAFAGLNIVSDPPPLLQSLGDTDDATRLVQVRDFMAGAPWLDTTLPRFGGAEPLLSHWSRLVDLPLALLMGFFSLFVSPADAEVAVRALWPLMLLAPLLYVIAKAAETRGGRAAALAALVLAILAFAGIVQFRPGRIDHHNVQNLAAIAGVILLAGAFDRPRLGALAGAVLGLGMAVGYEALLVTGAGLSIAVLMAAVTGRGRESVASSAVAFAAVLAIAFVATIAPSRWLDVRCDALSLNMVLLAGFGAAGIAGIFRTGAGWLREAQLGALAATGASAVALYLLAEPACISGPFGQVDPAVNPLWLDHVAETQSFVWLFKNISIVAVANLLALLAGLVAAGTILARERDDGAVLYAAVFAVTVILSLVQIKLVPYALLLSIAPLAVAIARIEPLPDISAVTLRSAGVLLLNQKTLLVASALVMGMNDPATEAFKKSGEAKKACYATEAVSELAGLPAGLAVAEVDMGPYIAALTPLSVLSAPYHRLDRQIIATHAIFNAQPADAEARLKAEGATYLVTCAALADKAKGPAAVPGSLRLALLAGETPGFLERVVLPGDTEVRVWRIKGR